MQWSLTIALLCLSSATIVDPDKKRPIYDSSSDSYEDYGRKSTRKHKTTRKTKDEINSDVLDFEGSCRRDFALEAFLSQSFKSMVCSPFAALMPLAQLALGAKGSTKDELLNALGLDEKREIDYKYKKLLYNLKSLPGVSISIASRIFVSDKFKVRKSFEERTAKIFGACVERVNFKKREAEDRMNSWVAKNTKCKFNYELKRDEQCVILNAFTFQAKWDKKFSNCGRRPFYGPNGEVTVPYMYTFGTFLHYYDGELDAEFIAIPYERKTATFILVLPKKRDGLPQLVRRLRRSPTTLRIALAKMTRKDMRVTIPKFYISTQLNMPDIYRTIGIHKAFSRDSRLTKMVKDEKMAISLAFQAIKMCVNEEGTYAVASTDVQTKLAMCNIDEKFIHADRPFLFYILAKREQLFAGVYTGSDSVTHRGGMHDPMTVQWDINIQFGRKNNFNSTN